MWFFSDVSWSSCHLPGMLVCHFLIDQSMLLECLFLIGQAHSVSLEADLLASPRCHPGHTYTDLPVWIWVHHDKLASIRYSSGYNRWSIDTMHNIECSFACCWPFISLLLFQRDIISKDQCVFLIFRCRFSLNFSLKFLWVIFCNLLYIFCQVLLLPLSCLCLAGV